MARKVERQAAYGCPSKGSSRGKEGDVELELGVSRQHWSWSLGDQGSTESMGIRVRLSHEYQLDVVVRLGVT
eukprot:scaffold22355_cov57-Cyclotella_meneghiniana.AAC.3